MSVLFVYVDFSRRKLTLCTVISARGLTVVYGFMMRSNST